MKKIEVPAWLFFAMCVMLIANGVFNLFAI